MNESISLDANRMFALNAEQQAIAEMARGFSQQKLAPKAIERDQEKHFPVDVLREAAALGMGAFMCATISAAAAFHASTRR